MKKTDEHYPLGASGAKTWRGCKGSYNYINWEKSFGNIPERTDTPWSLEGTTAHKYAEDYLTGAIKKEDIPEEFWEHLEGYCNFAQSLTTMNGGECITMNEQQVPYWYEPSKHGTLDYGVVAEDASELAILDLKYGAGVYVSATDNDQGAIYAISLIKQLEQDGYVFADDAKVTIYIYQPRHREFTGEPDSWETTYRELMDFAIDIEADYQASLTAAVTDLTPSNDACRFCEARIICNARTAHMFDEVPDEANLLAPANHDGPTLPAITTLNDASRVAIFKHHKEITKWMNDVVADSLTRIEQGDEIEGLKSVDGNQGNRSWGDNAKAVDIFLRAKIPHVKDRYKPRVLVSPAQAEKALKQINKPLKEQSKRFQTRWDELITRKPGSPTLTLADDEKPARIVSSPFEVEADLTEADCF
tara:strand:+ start:18454 stop:19707 length:1254 start_codon:yes stop_codon:yes gene_type:complete